MNVTSVFKYTHTYIYIYIYIIRPYQKTMAIKSHGESRQIAANRSIFHSKNNGDHFFEKSPTIAPQRVFQKTMAITLKVKFQLFLACIKLVHAGQYFFSI